jgi:hypothetical protein
MSESDWGSDGEENNNGDDVKRVKDLNYEQKLAIVNKTAELPSEDTDEAKRILQNIVPEGYGLSIMDFRTLIHPGRWVANGVAHPSAEQAFRSKTWLYMLGVATNNIFRVGTPTIE